MANTRWIRAIGRRIELLGNTAERDTFNRLNAIDARGARLLFLVNGEVLRGAPATVVR